MRSIEQTTLAETLAAFEQDLEITEAQRVELINGLKQIVPEVEREVLAASQLLEEAQAKQDKTLELLAHYGEIVVSNSGGRAGVQDPTTLTQDQQIVLNVMRRNPLTWMKGSELTAIAKVTRASSVILAPLVQDGRIERTGSRRGTRYRLKQ